VTDKIRTRLSVLLGLSMFVLPIVALAIGWIGRDLRTGAIAALVTFAACFLSSGILLATVKDLSWIAVALPFSLAVAYVVLPGFLTPGPFDDAAVMAAGALMTFGLWVRKQPDTPKWIVFPLLVSGLYTLVGDFIPGRVDELLVAAISTGAAIYGGVLRQPALRAEPQADEDEDVVEGEWVEEE
jgi:hypothetical protein